MAEIACPEEDLLMPLLSGDECEEEIAQHVEACPACARRLQRLRSTVQYVRDLFPAQTPAATAVASPISIGKYFIVAALGQGGQALVYRAVHPTLGKDLAIKLSREPIEMSQVERDLLFTEAKLLADLDHPNLARVCDMDFHEGRPFVVMEYIRGCSLQQHCAQTRPTPAQAARLVAPLARALAFAHRRGITHQDVKPDNIVIDDAGAPHLIDFGMARLRHGWGSCVEQPLGGTPGFMSPEQMRGEDGKVGPKCDIFALGGVLYYLLVGEAPFPGKDFVQVQAQTERGQVDLSLLGRAKAPTALVRVCQRALAANSADRYATASDLADDLQRYLDRPKRRKFMAAIVAGCAVVAGLALLLAGWFSPVSAVEFPPVPQYLISRVERDKLIPFPDALPLRTGDRVVFSCNLPRGFQAVMFACDSKGKWSEIALAPENFTSEGKFRLLRANGEVGPPAGTNLLLVCAGSTKLPTLKEMIALAGEHELDSLPEEWLVWMATEKDSDHHTHLIVEAAKPRSFTGSVHRTELEKVEERLRAVGQQLLERCEFFVGVAYPQRD